MMIRRVSFRLPETAEKHLLRVYSCRECFIEHKDHFLDPDDCWSVFLPSELIKRCRRDLESNLIALYEKVYDVVKAAIDDAIHHRYYAIIKRGGQYTGFRFLAQNAMMVICDKKTVSTAFIPASISTYHRSVWPERSWEKLVRDLRQIESYPGVSVLRVSEENWKRPPGFVSLLGRLAEEALRRKRNASESGERN